MRICGLADRFAEVLSTAITFPPLMNSQNKIYYKTIKYVISVIPNMIRSAVSVHSPESYCSLRGFAAHSQRSLRQFDSECTANPRRLQYDSTKTALQITNFLNRLKNFCSLATPPHMRWTEKCSIRSGVAVNSPKCESSNSLHCIIEQQKTILHYWKNQVTKVKWLYDPVYQ